MWKITGVAASNGIAIGKVMRLQEGVQDFARTIEPQAIAAEQARFVKAQKQGLKELAALQKRTARTVGEHQAQVFAAHQLMLEDPTLLESIDEAIRERCASAEAAVEEAVTAIGGMFAAMDDEYMRERAADIKDIGKRLIRILQGQPEQAAYEGILIAQDLLPSDTASLDLARVQGFVTALGGKTSHSSILARAAGIPATVGVGKALDELQDGDVVIVDGYGGEVLVAPEPAVLAEYEQRQAKDRERAAALAAVAHLTGETADGVRIEIASNIGAPKDMAKIQAAGAEGVGLFRTEFLFLDKESVPTEEEQFEAYHAVLSAMPDSKIVIRTLDAGGDKQLPFIGGLPEANPALGLRAIRLCLQCRDVFKTQLRALLRAAVVGKLHIMFPMIATLDELEAAKAVLQEAADELAAEGVAHRRDVPVGIMVEIPAAAVMADELAQEVDFFSIGTNDLVQYTMAADRMNEHVAWLSDYFQPPVIRLIGQVAKAAKAHGKWVGMCGEMAGDVLAAPLLVGLGLTELSMNARSVPGVKHRVRQFTLAQAEEWAGQVLKLRKATDVKVYLEQISSQFEI